MKMTNIMLTNNPSYIFFSALFLACSCFAEDHTSASTNNITNATVVEEKTKILDLTADEKALNAFLDSEAKDSKMFAEKFLNDESFREKFADLTLNAQHCRFKAEDGTVIENIHFRDLPKDSKKRLKQEFITNFSAYLTNTTQEQKTSWHGLTAIDLAFLVPLCYISGRQVRGAGIPGTDELFTLTGPVKIIGDIALGYAANMFATICHECGHAVACRMFYGKWPKSITIGSSNPQRPAIIETSGGAFALRGLNLNGITVYPDDGIDLQEARSIPVCAAGGICGMAGYYGLKKLIYTLLGKQLSMIDEIDARFKNIDSYIIAGDNKINGWFGLEQNADTKTVQRLYVNNPQIAIAILPLAVDMADWIELRNIFLMHDIQGTDANCIAAATDTQLCKLWNAIAAKFKKNS